MKKTVEQMTKDEMLEEATRLGLEDQVTYKTRKADVLELVQKELRKRERAAARALEPKPELVVAPKPIPTPAPAVPAATVAEKPAPAVVPGTIKKVEPVLEYFVDQAVVDREKFMRIASAAYVTRTSLMHLEAVAAAGGKAGLTVTIRLPGRIRRMQLAVRRG